MQATITPVEFTMPKRIEDRNGLFKSTNNSHLFVRSLRPKLRLLNKFSNASFNCNYSTLRSQAFKAPACESSAHLSTMLSTRRLDTKEKINDNRFVTSVSGSEIGK
jgi:hypothetical protein